jgi:hypothetical protein
MPERQHLDGLRLWREGVVEVIANAGQEDATERRQARMGYRLAG